MATETWNMTREEWKTWARSLKPGDKVIVKSWCRVFLDAVKHITPSGWVVTEHNGTFAQSRYDKRYTQRGGYYDLLPVTEELEKQAITEMKEEEERKKVEDAISDAKRIAYEWAYGKRKINYDIARKIIEIAGEKETEKE